MNADAEVMGLNGGGGGNRLDCVSGSQKYMRTGLISTMPKKQQLQLHLQQQQQQQQQKHFGNTGTTSTATTKPKYSLTLLNMKNGAHHQSHNNNNSSSINNNNNHYNNASMGSVVGNGVGNCQLHPHRKSPHPHLQPQYAYYQQQQQQQQQQQTQHLPQSKREQQQQRQQMSQSYYHPPPPPRHQLRVLRLSSAPTGAPEATSAPATAITTKATAAAGTANVNGVLARREVGGDRNSGEFNQRNSAHSEQMPALTPTTGTTPTIAATTNPLDASPKHLADAPTVACVDNSSDSSVESIIKTAPVTAATGTTTTATAPKATTPNTETPTTVGPMSNVLRANQQQQQQKANRLCYH